MSKQKQKHYTNLHNARALFLCISVLVSLSYIVPPINKNNTLNNSLLDKILGSFGNNVFVEASSYCQVGSDSGSVSYATVNNQTETTIAISDNDTDSSYTGNPEPIPGTTKFWEGGEYEVRFQQPRNGKLKLNTLYTRPDVFQGYWNQPLAYPNYSLTYIPNPGFSGTESFKYYVRGTNLGYDGACIRTANININVPPPTLSCNNLDNYAVSTSLSVFSSTFDPDISNNHSVDTIATASLNCDVDLTIKKESVGSFVQGQTGTYLLSVTNNWSSRIEDVITVKDQLPSNMKFVSATGVGWECSEAANLVTCVKKDGLNSSEVSNISLIVDIVL